MNRQSSHRRVRKRKSQNQNSRMKLSGFLGIMLLAVFLGYLTARFVVGPMIGYDADESPARIADETSGADESGEENEKTDSEASAGNLPTGGYALQFGAFSTMEAAEKLSDSLKTQGVDTEIVKAGDVYKVISPVLETKEKALEKLAALPETEAEDVFVASFE